MFGDKLAATEMAELILAITVVKGRLASDYAMATPAVGDRPTEMPDRMKSVVKLSRAVTHPAGRDRKKVWGTLKTR